MDIESAFKTKKNTLKNLKIKKKLLKKTTKSNANLPKFWVKKSILIDSSNCGVE